MSIIISVLGIFIICIIIGSVVLAVFLIIKNRKSKALPSEKKTTKITLGATIKEHRIRCNMTQEFVAETLGVSRQAVSKWEKGDSDPKTSNLLELAKIFGVSAAELLESVE